jgi:hypothetical protein
MSPCIALTVKLLARIFSVNQSTLRFVLQKMTACTTAQQHMQQHRSANGIPTADVACRHKPN